MSPFTTLMNLKPITLGGNRRYDGQDPKTGIAKSSLDLFALVRDEIIRGHASGFDGKERPFVLVPRFTEKGGLAWDKFYMPFKETSATNFQNMSGQFESTPTDRYEMKIPNVDMDAINKFGVAVGADTNVGAIWGQAPGDNLFRAK
jgi:hypothetical protein